MTDIEKERIKTCQDKLLEINPFYKHHFDLGLGYYQRLNNRQENENKILFIPKGKQPIEIKNILSSKDLSYIQLIKFSANTKRVYKGSAHMRGAPYFTRLTSLNGMYGIYLNSIEAKTENR